MHFNIFGYKISYIALAIIINVYFVFDVCDALYYQFLYIRDDEYCRENLWTMICLLVNVHFVENILEVMVCMVLFIGIIKVRLNDCSTKSNLQIQYFSNVLVTKKIDFSVDYIHSN